MFHIEFDATANTRGELYEILREAAADVLRGDWHYENERQRIYWFVSSVDSAPAPAAEPPPPK